MSKRQTRSSVSIQRELRERLYAFAEARGIPAAQVVTQGIEAVITGAIDLAPAADSAMLAKQTRAQRAGKAPA